MRDLLRRFWYRYEVAVWCGYWRVERVDYAQYLKCDPTFRMLKRRFFPQRTSENSILFLVGKKG